MVEPAEFNEAMNEAMLEMNSAIAVAIRAWAAQAVAMAAAAEIVRESFNGITTNSLERPADNDGDGRY